MSETLSGVTQLRIGNICLFIGKRVRHLHGLLNWDFMMFINNWRASEASETLSGVTQLRIGDFCLYVCGDIHISFALWPSYIFVLARCSTPSLTSLNRIFWFSDHNPYHPRNWIIYCFEFFCGCSLTQKLAWVPFQFELVAVVSWYAICHSYKPYATVFTSIFIVH